MNSEKFAREVKKGQWRSRLSGEMAAKLEAMPLEELKKAVDEVTGVPITFIRDISGPLYELYFTASWAEAFTSIRLGEDPKVLEIASGSSDPVPQAMEIYTKGRGSYITANLNKELTEGLYRNTAGLGVEIQVIEDNASNLEQYCKEDTFDVVAFQHAVNDIIQTIVADIKGIDTVHNDWFDILPQMVKGAMEYYETGALSEMVYDAFMEIIGVCYRLLKPGGYMIFNTHVFQMDLDAGYSMELYGNFIPLAREWILDSDLDVEDVEVEGFDPQWWMFLRKV